MLNFMFKPKNHRFGFFIGDMMYLFLFLTVVNWQNWVWHTLDPTEIFVYILEWSSKYFDCFKINGAKIFSELTKKSKILLKIIE